MAELTARPDLGAVGGKIDPRVWKIVYVVILGAVMSALDSTMVSVALVQLSRELHSQLSDVQWVVSAYLLAMAAVTPGMGWATRRFGSKRVYLSAMMLFTGASLLCGLAASAPELVVFRVLQGVGGGAMMPVGQMIIMKAAGPRHLARVMSAWGGVVMLAPVVGPTLGGLILDISSWRWIFYVNIPIGMLTLLLGRRLLPASPPEPAGGFDALGWFLVAAGSVAFTYGLAEVASSGHGMEHVALPLVAGVLLLVAFVVRGLHVEHPLLDLRLYANKAFRASALTTFCLGGMVMIGSLILMPLYFQIVGHDDPLRTGLLLGPRGAGTAVAMWLSGRLTDRFGPGIIAVSGSVIAILGSIPFVMIQADTPYGALAVFMLVQGFGMGLAGMPAMTAAYRTLRPSQINDATPQSNMIMRLGGSIGVAVLLVILQRQLSGAGSSTSAQTAAFATTFWWVLGLTIVSLVPTISVLVLERRHALVPLDSEATTVTLETG